MPDLQSLVLGLYFGVLIGVCITLAVVNRLDTKRPRVIADHNSPGTQD